MMEDENFKLPDNNNNMEGEGDGYTGVPTSSLLPQQGSNSNLGEDKYINKWRHNDQMFVQNSFNNINNNENDFVDPFPRVSQSSIFLNTYDPLEEKMALVEDNGYATGVMVLKQEEKYAEFIVENSVANELQESLITNNQEEIQKIQDKFLEKSIKESTSLIRQYNTKGNKPKTCNKGGVLGGDKYVKEDLLIKKPVKHDKIHKTEEEAMKIVGHEQKAFRSIANSILKKRFAIALPLTCSVEYKGYKTSVQSILPISKATLVYGSCDGGNSVYKMIPHLNQMMDELGKDLNLKQHSIKAKNNSNVSLFTPGDLEVHMSDSKFYLIDPSRIFPQRNNCWSQLFRPEFLAAYPKPLCSDSYSNWDFNDPINIEEIKEAVSHLENKIIPEFAEIHKEFPFFDESISDRLHQYGINVKYLGHIRALFNDAACFNSKLFLNEMIARHLKKQFSELLRTANSSDDLLLKEALVCFLNNISSDASFWKLTIKDRLVSRFPKCLSLDEFQPGFDLRDSLLSFSSMIYRFLDLIGIEISYFPEGPFSVELFSDFKPIVKTFRYTFDDFSQSFVVGKVERVSHLF